MPENNITIKFKASGAPALEKATIENKKNANDVKFVTLAGDTEMSTEDIQKNLIEWENELSRYIEERKLIYKIRKDDRKKKKQIENKIQDEENIHGSTIYVLSRLNRKIGDTEQTAFNKVETLLEDINKKENECFDISTDKIAIAH